jgi:Clp amino terminal domain, pathogenicity island component
VHPFERFNEHAKKALMFAQEEAEKDRRSWRVRKLIELAFEEARRWGQGYVGTEHLLLGILLEGESVAAHVLNDIGITLERARAEIESLLRERGDVPFPTMFGGVRSPSPPEMSEPDALIMLALLLRRLDASLQAPETSCPCWTRSRRPEPIASRRPTPVSQARPGRTSSGFTVCAASSSPPSPPGATPSRGGDDT